MAKMGVWYPVDRRRPLVDGLRSHSSELWVFLLKRFLAQLRYFPQCDGANPNPLSSPPYL